MLWIKVILLLSSISIVFVIVLGNPGLLPVTILGTPTPPLPLWSLLLGAIFFGGLTGTLLLRLLEPNPSRKTVTQRTAKPPKKPPRSKQTAKSTAKQKVKSNAASQTRRVSGTDWDETPAEDWFGSSAKVSGTEYASRSPRDDRSTPRSSQTKRNPGSDRVVDADYRVIAPPHVSSPPRRPKDDWDDEFFEDEP
jgi:hypothetical protein